MTKSTTVVSAADIKLRVLAQASLGSFGGLFAWYIDRGFSADQPLALLLEVINDRWSDADRAVLTEMLGIPENYLLPLVAPAGAAAAVAQPDPVPRLIRKIRHRKSGEEAVLSLQNAKLLNVLMGHSDKLLQISELSRELGHPNSEASRVALQRLRAALAKIGGEGLILNEPGIGYRFNLSAFKQLFHDATDNS